LSQSLGFPRDRFAQFWSKSQAINDFYAAAQQFPQALRKPDMVAQTIVCFEVNQKIDIASRLQSAAQNRAEYSNLARAMLARERHDLLALPAELIKRMDCCDSHFL